MARLAKIKYRPVSVKTLFFMILPRISMMSQIIGEFRKPRHSGHSGGLPGHSIRDQTPMALLVLPFICIPLHISL